MAKSQNAALIEALLAQSGAASAAPSAQPPALPSLDELGIEPAKSGNAAVDVAAGAIKGLGDVGFGLQELIYEAAHGALRGGMELGELTGLLRDGIGEEFSDSMRDTQDRRIEQASDFRQTLQDGADSVGVGGRDGIVENIARFGSGVATGGGAIGKAAPALVKLLKTGNPAQRLAALAALEGGGEALSFTETRDAEDQQNLSNMLAEMGLNTGLAVNEDDSGLTKRMKVGTEGAALSAMLGGALVGGSKGIKALKARKGAADEIAEAAPPAKKPEAAASETLETSEDAFLKSLDELEAAAPKYAKPAVEVPAAARAAADETVARIGARAARYGLQGVDIEVTRKLIDGVAEGSWDAGRKLIKASLEAKDPVGVFDHEILHVARRGLTDQENKALNYNAKTWRDEFDIDTRYPELKGNDEALNEEAMAEAFRRYAREGEAPKGIMRTIYGKFKETFDRVGQALKGEGWKTADDVFKAIGRGDVLKRQAAEDAAHPVIKYAKAEGVAEESVEAFRALDRRGRINFQEDWDVIQSGMAKTQEAITDAVKAVARFKDDPSALKEAPGKAMDFLKGVRSPMLLTNDGNMRALAHKLDYQPIRDLAERFHYGRGGADGKDTFHEIRNGLTSQWDRRMVKVLGKMSDEDRIAVRDVMVGLAPEAGAGVRKAADEMRKLADDIYEAAKAKGLELGKKDKWFHRSIDVDAVMQDPDGFQRRAAEAYMKNGVSSADEATQMAKVWFDDIMAGRNNFHMSDQLLFSNDAGVDMAKKAFEKNRAFDEQADAILRDFYEKDPLRVMQKYHQGVAKRIAFQDVMGGEAGWTKFRQDMIDAGHQTDIAELEYLLKNTMGVQTSNLSHKTRARMSLLQTAGSVSLLEHSLLSSLAEPFLAGARAGSPAEALSAFHTTYKSILKSADTAQLRDTAEFLGLVSNDLIDTVNAARLNTSMDDNFGNRAIEGFYRRIGMTAFTDASRVASLKIGQRYIQRQALKAAKGNRIAMRELQSLGFRPQNVKAFAGRVEAGDLDDALEAFKAGGKAEDFMDDYRRSMTRFVNESVMAPNTTVRPPWANTPVGRLAYALTSYIFSFQKNVLNRNASKVKEAVTETGLDMSERAELLAPSAMLMGIYPFIHAAVNYGRDAAFNPDRLEQMNGWDHAGKAISRAGLPGVADPIMNAFTGVRYDRDLASLPMGAYGGFFLGAAQNITNGFVSPTNSNSDDRMIAKGVFDGIVLPTTNMLLATVPGGTGIKAAAGAGIYAMGAKSAKDAFVDLTAGGR